MGVCYPRLKTYGQALDKAPEIRYNKDVEGVFPNTEKEIYYEHH